jgi:glycosyltransferase involved in cell wall biosynthesis
VVIPALNEVATVGAVIRAAGEVVDDVVLVDDGSTDGTADAAAEAGATVVRHEANRGYDAALASGFAAADRLGADVIVSMDADGQHEAARLREVVAPFIEGEVGVVLGTRERAARWSERVFSAYTRARFGVDDILCGVKGFEVGVYRRHRPAMDEHSIGTALALAALRTGVPHTTVGVPIRPREGATRFGLGLRADLRILRAFGLAVWDDVTRRRR